MLTAPSELAGVTRPAVRARPVIARFVATSATRSGAVWGLVFGLYVTTQALAYSTTYKNAAARQLLVQEFGHDAGISALVGPATRIDTISGYIDWKCLTVLVIMGAVWGVLTSTRLTRGEEDAGRWEMLLAGPTDRRRALAQASAGLFAGAVALFAVSALVLVALGRSSKVHVGAGSMAFFAVAVVAGALMFSSVGVLSAQLASTRRQAAGVASAVLVVSYALRMVADSGSGMAWLRWVSPLGWVEELEPLTHPSPLALVPIGLFTAALAAAALYLAGRRDLGAGVFADHANLARVRTVPTRRYGLGLYLARATFIAWAVSLVAYGLLLGSIAKAGGKVVTSSATIRHALARLGLSGTDAYLGFAMLIMSIGLCFVAASSVAALRREESSGQLDNLLVRSLARGRWLADRLSVASASVIVLGLVAGFATWLGAVSDHAHVSLSSLISAGLNTAAPALLLLGLGVLVMALRPRWTNVATYSLFVWFVLVEILGSAAKVNHWILDTSALHQMAPAPAVGVDWTVDAVMVALALASALLGQVFFARRDLSGE